MVSSGDIQLRKAGTTEPEGICGEAMIVCADVAFQYPHSSFRLLIDSWRLDQGESAVLIGPSGSGKSTLLDLIGGVRRPSAGRLRVDRMPMETMSESRRRQFRLERVGFVFQAFDLFEHLTVRENILFPAGASGRLRNERATFETELARLSTATGLTEKLDRRIGTLSRGEQQRVALARALVHRPTLVLADEPTGNLDPANKQAAMRLLHEMISETGATLVVATHDHSLLADFDHVVEVADWGTHP